MSTITIQATPRVIEGLLAAAASADSKYGLWDEIIAFFYGDKPTKVDGLGTVEMVEDEGGEDQGSKRWATFKITFDSDESVVYYQKTGYYSSYDGTDWDGDFFEVKPAQKYVTTYVKA